MTIRKLLAGQGVHRIHPAQRQSRSGKKMSDVVSLSHKCMFCSREVMAPWRSLCTSCFDEHNRKEPEPTAVEILAMDISDLQDDVAEMHRRLSGKRVNEEQASAERKERFERMLALVEAALGEKRG
jgi:hypothetical protein